MIFNRSKAAHEMRAAMRNAAHFYLYFNFSPSYDFFMLILFYVRILLRNQMALSTFRTVIWWLYNF